MKSIRKVLFPTKFEELSFRCIEWLYPLKAAGLEEIILLHVIDRDEVAHNLFRGFDKQLAQQIRQEAKLKFDDWSREIAESGIECRQVVEVGRPEGKILEVSCREEVDLILAGPHEHQVADAVYLGGTSMGVLRRTAIPVMVCKHGSPEEIAQEMTGISVFERVLYATDFSTDAACGLEFIKALNGATKTAEVVHVITERDFRKHTDEEMRVEEEECRERLAQICQELRDCGLQAEPHLLAGHTSAEVLQSASDYRATVIVMGTKGKHGIKEIWLGSASHRVAELATIPVILVPQERDECYI